MASDNLRSGLGPYDKGKPGCAVYTFHSILSGEVNGSVNLASNIWDIGPGCLILEEAKGAYQVVGGRWDMGAAKIPYCLMADSQKTLNWLNGNKAVKAEIQSLS